MFGSAYLGAATDRAMYIYTVFNADTGAVSGHAVSIEKRGGASAGCFKMYFTGKNWKVENNVVKGSLVVYKTQDSLSSTGHSVTSTAKDGAEMDGVDLPSLQSKNFCQDSGNANYDSNCKTVSSSTITSTASFNKSCNDLKTAAASATSPFYNNDANFTATAAQVFGN